MWEIPDSSPVTAYVSKKKKKRRHTRHFEAKVSTKIHHFQPATKSMTASNNVMCWHTLFCYQYDKASLQPTTWKILNMKLRQKSTLNAITIPCSVKLTTVSTKIDNYFHGNHANHVIHISFTGKQTYRLC